MKKIFTSFFLFFVFAFFLNTVVAQNGSSFGPAPSGTEASKNGNNTSNVANPLSRAFCYNGNINFQLNKQSLSNTTLTPVGSTVPFVFPGAAAWNYSNNKMYVIDQGAPFALYTVDTLTGVRTFIANCTGVPQNNFTGMTWDPVTGNMYGVSSTISVSQIFTVNITTGVCTPIGSPTATVPGAIMINAAPSGSLFTVDIVGDNLYRWNKTTGVPTLIGPIGFNANFGQDAHFDFSDGQYYYAAFNSTAGQAQLRTIDTLTGGGTLIGSYAGQVSTFGIFTPLAPTVTINQAAGQADPTSSAPINFTAEFSQNVTGFATGDVTISGTAGATTATVTGSGSTYNVAVSGMTVGGTVIVNIPAGVAVNANNEPNEPSTSTDNTVTYSLPAGCTSVDNVPNQTVCTGASTAAVNFSSPTPGTFFSWTNSNPAIGLAASGNGNIASFIATNPGVTPITGTITVTPFVVTGGGPCTPSAPQTFTNNTPVAIPTGPALITSTIVVAGAPTFLMDLNMQTFITHTSNADLDITITSPAGTVVTLTTDNGGTNDNVFNGTIWDDDANPGGQVPYTSNNGLVTDQTYVNLTVASPLVPEEAFGAFIGEDPNGTWTIRISDDASSNGGSLNSWSLTMTGLASAPITTNTSFTNNTPVTIPTSGVVSSTINVTGLGTSLLDANVLTSINHTWSDDMDITITSPAGTVVTLTTDNGGSNDNTYAGTTWDDDANPGGQVPYTSNNGMATDHTYANNTTATPLVPEEALAAFVGEDPNGVWTLRISDDTGGDGGVLNSWGLNLQTATCGTLCAGPSTSFTITVSPNPNIVIIADPGTTICEGDPTLLTVRVGTSSPVGTLYTQGTTPVNGSPSQVFEPANAAFTSQAADDFIVPAGALWTVTQITANGIGAGTPTSVNVFFYSNSGGNLPGAAIASFTNINTFVRVGGNYTVTLPTPVNLSGGTYWMSMQVNMSFATGGQWFWGNFGASNINSEYAWQNPGGGFATPCTSWGYGGTGCNVGGGPGNRNNIFSIVGTSVADGGPLPPGYTFLWSPAAGLSSTTSNPVAASPMNTTTYTVTVTTPGNCTRTASILITVNKRPVVTTQPANSVRCVGNTATFTVAGTGTGLTYQWQVSPTGCAGPWTNLTNTAPYSGVNTAVLTVTSVTQLMSGYAYRAVLSGACAPINNANISDCAVLTVNPNPTVTITPPVSCGGVAGLFGTQLSVASAPPPVPGQVTVNSGAISVPIPDGSGVAATTNLTVAGIPANATITEVKVNMNISHTWVGDVDVNLRAPNNAILNLVGSLDGGTGGNSTDNFTNTTFSSLGGASISGAPAPRTGTFAAEARPGYGPIGFIQTVTNWAGLIPPATPTAANGQWTLAAGDFVGSDVGTITNWSITIDYTTPGGGGGPTLTYVWSPLGGLYNNSTATVPYTGTNTPIVYAAPTQLTVYTVRATDVATGCFTDATAIVNYTPPAPTVTPNPVTMCLGDPAVLLRSASSTPGSRTINSGPLTLAIPDGPASWPQTVFPGVVTPNLAVSTIPAGATITGMSVKLNLTHTYIADMVIVLKAPNGNVFNLSANINRTGGPGANFINTIISSASNTPLSAGTPPYTGTFRADAVGATYVAVGFTFPGGPTSPAGYIPTVTQFSGLYSTPNGNWTLGIYDWGAGDLGTLTDWELKFDYVIGVPATPAVWTPIGGLYSDASASTPYVAGTAVDSVWARPTPPGVYTYQATVQSMPVLATFTNPANIVINASGPGNPYPSNLTVSGLPTSGVGVDSVRLTGISHTWGNDIDILLQSPSGQNVVLMSDIGGTVAVPNATYTFRDGAPALNAGAANPTGTYSPTNNGAADTWPAPGPGAITQGSPTLASFGNTANVNGDWKLFVFDDVGGDAGSISGGYTIWFNVSVPACTSPARTVTVTVNTPTTVTTQPVNQTICTDKVATFTVVPGGSGPFTYQWQVSINGGNPPWTNITNGGVYSGATTATLTITAPPVSMSGYQYRVIITGAAPCAPATSFTRILTVNPLPVIVISASPTTSLFPGMTTTLSSTVTPNAASQYTWLRNGVAVPGANSATHVVDVDNLGDYTLRVTDINGCTNTSNMITIKDSASGRCFIYPNPTSGMFQVRYYSVANNVLPRTLTIYDSKGDRVFTKLYTIGRPYDRMDVDMRAYSKGLYWVEIGDMNGSRLSMCRVVIQ